MIPIEKETNELHHCQKRTFKCKDCHMELFWDKSMKSKSGKMIPIDRETNKPHYCQMKVFKCGNCNAEYVWAEAPNGEGRPHIDGKIHDCRGLWDDQGDDTDDEDTLSRQAWEAEQRNWYDLEQEEEEEEELCPSCNGYGCADCGGEGTAEGFSSNQGGFSDFSYPDDDDRGD